jgi:hypothetical protein
VREGLHRGILPGLESARHGSPHAHDSWLRVPTVSAYLIHPIGDVLIRWRVLLYLLLLLLAVALVKADRSPEVGAAGERPATIERQ